MDHEDMKLDALLAANDPRVVVATSAALMKAMKQLGISEITIDLDSDEDMPHEMIDINCEGPLITIKTGPCPVCAAGGTH